MATQVAFTAEQLARMPDDGTRHEIDRGELLTMTLPNRRHGRLQMRIGLLLGKFLDGKNLGELVSESGFILTRNPDTLRGPDIAFVRHERLKGLAENAWIPGAPDLTIEILSPSDTALEMDRKVQQYLDAGAHAVWIVNPERELVHVYEPGGVTRIVEGEAILSSPAALPGFSILAREIFGQ